MSKEIEWFKRFAACYLQWSHSNFDRIVRDAVRRHKAEMADAKLEPFRTEARKLFSASNEWLKEYRDEWERDTRWIEGINWGSKDFKVGTVLKIRLPLDVIKDRELSFWEKLLTGTNSLFRSLTHRA